MDVIACPNPSETLLVKRAPIGWFYWFYMHNISQDFCTRLAKAGIMTNLNFHGMYSTLDICQFLLWYGQLEHDIGHIKSRWRKIKRTKDLTPDAHAYITFAGNLLGVCCGYFGINTFVWVSIVNSNWHQHSALIFFLSELCYTVTLLYPPAFNR